MNTSFYWVRHLTFFFQLVLISWRVTLSSCLIWQIIGFILPPNEYGCVNVSLSGPAIDLQKMPILAKKSSFQMKLILILAGILNKQNCRIWGTENSHAYIEKPTHSKRVIVCCGFWYRGIIGPIFFENKHGKANGQWRLLSGYDERIFVHKNWRGRYWQYLVSIGWRYVPQPKLHPMFCTLFLKITLSAAELM